MEHVFHQQDHNEDIKLRERPGAHALHMEIPCRFVFMPTQRIGEFSCEIRAPTFYC